MQKSYMERVRECVTVNKLYHLKEDDIWQILETTKPIIFDGHFQLLSGRHADTFFRFSSICKLPYFVSTISNEMIPWINEELASGQIDVVLGVASQGMFLAFDLASKLKTRVAFSPINKDTGKPEKKLISGFTIAPDDRVLIVNDMTTTGHGVETLETLVQYYGAQIAGICLFGNRGVDEPDVINLQNKYQNRFRTIIQMKMKTWQSEKECPICNSEHPLPLIHSKQINHLPIYSKENEYELYLRKLKDLSGQNNYSHTSISLS